MFSQPLRWLIRPPPAGRNAICARSAARALGESASVSTPSTTTRASLRGLRSSTADSSADLNAAPTAGTTWLPPAAIHRRPAPRSSSARGS